MMRLSNPKEYNIFSYVKKQELAKNDNIQIHESETCGKILVRDGEAQYCEKDKKIYSEMLAHVALSNHPNTKEILCIGYNPFVLHELKQYTDIQNITIVETNQDNIDLINKHWETSTDASATVLIKDDFIFEQKDFFDIILMDKMSTDALDFYHLQRALKSDGLLVCKTASYYTDMPTHKQIATALDEYFKIIMPYSCASLVQPVALNTFFFCSNKFHPTADVVLQKADLLDDLVYYNSDIHKASFILPTSIDKELFTIIKK